MAVTVSAVSGSSAQTTGRTEDVFGRRRVGLYRITFDTSYSAGGEAWDPVTSGFQGPVAAVFISKRSLGTVTFAGFTVEYDFTNKKLFVYDGDATAAEASGDLSTLVVDVLVIGE